MFTFPGSPRTAPSDSAEMRLVQIHARAEVLGLELIQGGLVTDDPDLAAVVGKLESFRPVLVGKEVSEEKIRQLLKTGFGMVSFELREDNDDKTEAFRLLHALADKLKTMGAMAAMFL